MPLKEPKEPKLAKHSIEERKALGERLASARSLAGLNQADAAYAMDMTKGGLSAWETGRNIPDALMLRRMAKTYGTSADSLLWDNPVTTKGMQVAAAFDSLNPAQQERFETLWRTFFAESLSDADVEDRMPATKKRAMKPQVEKVRGKQIDENNLPDRATHRAKRDLA